MAAVLAMAACGTEASDDDAPAVDGGAVTCEPTEARRRSCFRVCSLGGVMGDTSTLQLCATAGEYPAAACTAECVAGVSAGTWCP